MNSSNKDPRSTEKSGEDQLQSPAEQGEQEERRNILGEKFRRARSGKGLSLEEAAAATRIHATTLEALEENNTRLLPAQVFTRGFVRIYAGYLGLDPDQALRQHIKEQGLPTSSTTEKINIQEILASEIMAEAPRGLTGNHIVLLLLALALGFSLYWGYNSFFRPQAASEFYLPQTFLEEQVPEPAYPEPEPPFLSPGDEEIQPEEAAPPESAPALPKEASPAPVAVAVEPPPPAPVAVPKPTPPAPVSPAPSGPRSAAEPRRPEPAAAERTIVEATADQVTEAAADQTTAERAEEGVQVVIAHFTEDTWLRLQIDDQPPRQLFFQPGDTQTWQAREKIELRIGNAGGVKLSLNDNPLPSLGRSGQTVNLRLP